MKKISGRKRRYLRGKKKLLGTKERPRLCVYRSLNNLTAQLIDDITGKTLFSVSTLDKTVKEKFKNRGNVAASKALGELLAKRALDAKIKRVKFDRSGYLYHGRIKAFAETCKNSGLQF